ncbi:BZ3500_MvSof-1268-A1-R1_Chr3-2g06363 [Microbotryum saponariae]|uniref:BZ3500_MvSof-1268-A1-R1_Chr3-2g06363 protein n=1 Tax=Microbotryum saponariae TaxID=289078 RepID=A0A2X0LBK8_9BASI|nr:BZ3500_MvSof-1268-A1-R1_Chr3-2g06363 [Microbotryum saponariae]SDA04334.1 BZ3501_MvSof-1269-A2-R1_Chr3-2g06054 [Microbotryum saponariae]
MKLLLCTVALASFSTLLQAAVVPVGGSRDVDQGRKLFARATSTAKTTTSASKTTSKTTIKAATTSKTTTSSSKVVTSTAAVISFACPVGKFAYSSSCVTSCPGAYFENTTARAFQACKDRNAGTCNDKGAATSCTRNTWLFAGTCVSSCPPTGYYADRPTRSCIGCLRYATTCDASGALTCPTGQFISTINGCVSSCRAWNYLDKDDCATVDANAATCNSTQAFTCKSNTFAYQGKCVSSCPAKFLNSPSGACLPCGDADAQTCSIVSQGLVATSCGVNFLTTAGVCAAVCPTSYYPDLTTHTCKRCSDPRASACSATEATACTGSVLSLGACVDKCPVSQYADDKAVCRNCQDSNALSCTSTAALTCNAPTYLNAGTCVSNCPSGLFSDDRESLIFRTSRKEQGPSISDFTRSCVIGTNCSITTFAKSTTSHCTDCETHALTCVSETRALTCDKDTYLTNAHCLTADQCPPGTYPDSASRTCRRCSTLAPNSRTCDAKGAIACNPDANGAQTFLTASKQCVFAAQCPMGTWPKSDDDALVYVCNPCDDGTTSCTDNGAGYAISCGTTSAQVDVYLDKALKTCVATCPVKFFPQASSSTCERCDDGDDNCSANGEGTALKCGLNSNNQQTFLSPSKDCVLDWGCAAAGPYFPDYQRAACVSCDSGELACNHDGAGGATRCGKDAISGVQLYLAPSKDCVTEDACPTNTWVDKQGNTCAACPYGALQCNSATDATICGADPNNPAIALYLQDGLCITADKCPAMTHADPRFGVCAAN